MRDVSEIPFIRDDGVFAIYERERLRAMEDARNAEGPKAAYAAAVVANGLWPAQARHGSSVLRAIAENPSLRADPRRREFTDWMHEWIRLNGEDQSRAWVEYQNSLLAHIGEDEARRVLDAWARPRADAIEEQLNEAEQRRPSWLGGPFPSPGPAPLAPPPPPIPAAPTPAMAQGGQGAAVPTSTRPPYSPAAERAGRGSLIGWLLRGFLAVALIGFVVALAANGIGDALDDEGEEGELASGSGSDTSDGSPRDGNGGAVGDGDGSDTPQGEDSARVTRVIDGDTVVLSGIGPTRLIGIDTPERGDCGYDDATEFTRSRIGGETVEYVVGIEARDRYDRLLAYVIDPRARMHNLELVRAGYAVPLTIPPNTSFANRFKRAAQKARSRYGDIPRGACEPEPAPPPPEPDPPPAPDPSPDPDPPSGGGGGGGGGIPENCSGVAGPIPTPPGDPTGLDADGDGQACE